MLHQIAQDSKELGAQRHELPLAPHLLVDGIKSKRRTEQLRHIAHSALFLRLCRSRETDSCILCGVRAVGLGEVWSPSALSNVAASCKSAVSNPSVNHP